MHTIIRHKTSNRVSNLAAPVTVVYGELPRLLLSTVGSPWIVKFGLVWVFRMPFNFVVVGVLTDSARLEPSNYAKMSLSVPCVAELLQGNQGGLGLLLTRHRRYCKPGLIKLHPRVAANVQ